MSENTLNEQALTIPATDTFKGIKLSMTATKEAESRLDEAQSVSPVTYSALEAVYGAGWRESRTNHSVVGSELLNAQKKLEEAKSDFLIDAYPEIIKDLPKSHDSADLRKAHLMRYKPYTDALDRTNMLTATLAFLDGKMKTFERTSAWLKKKMDLILRSGLSNSNLYITSGKK